MRDHRRQRRGLEEHRVAGGQRHDDLAERDRQRKIPRGDHQHDAPRLVVDVARAVPHERDRDLLRLQDAAGVLGEVHRQVSQRKDLEDQRLVIRLAVLAAQQASDLVRGGQQPVGEGQQHVTALGERPRRPPRLRDPRPAERVFGVLPRRHGHRTDLPAVDRAVNVQERPLLLRLDHTCLLASDDEPTAAVRMRSAPRLPMNSTERSSAKNRANVSLCQDEHNGIDAEVAMPVARIHPRSRLALLSVYL